MGRIILHMMISVDGMVSGPQGELDWIANDEPLNQDHLARLEQADAVILGAGGYAMSRFWTAAEHDEKAEAIMRDLGRVINKIPKIVYSHKDMPVDWRNTKVHVVKDDKALVEADVLNLSNGEPKAGVAPLLAKKAQTAWRKLVNKHGKERMAHRREFLRMGA